MTFWSRQAVFASSVRFFFISWLFNVQKHYHVASFCIGVEKCCCFFHAVLPVNGCSSFSSLVAGKPRLERRGEAKAGSNTKLCRWSDTRVAKKSRTSFHFKLELSSTWGSNLDTAIPEKNWTEREPLRLRELEQKKKKENFANCYPATLTTKRGKTIWNPSRFISSPPSALNFSRQNL